VSRHAVSFSLISDSTSCSQDDSFASQIKRIKFLVIDEADRMIETGHFAELENIVGLTVRTKEMLVI
jgi:superfamily II DNA/RNA helicase